jgi:hypothetical protein
VTILIDEVNAVGPAGVSLLGGVTEFVEHGGKLDPQLANARAGHQRALFFTLGAGKDDLVFYIALHLPDVAGMCFRDVHDQEADFALVLIVELVEGGNLPPEGWSSVTAKNHHHRLSLIQLG